MTTATMTGVVGWSATAHPDRLHYHKLGRKQRGSYTMALCRKWVTSTGLRAPANYQPCPVCYGRRR